MESLFESASGQAVHAPRPPPPPPPPGPALRAEAALGFAALMTRRGGAGGKGGNDAYVQQATNFVSQMTNEELRVLFRVGGTFGFDVSENAALMERIRKFTKEYADQIGTDVSSIKPLKTKEQLFNAWQTLVTKHRNTHGIDGKISWGAVYQTPRVTKEFREFIVANAYAVPPNAEAFYKQGWFVHRPWADIVTEFKMRWTALSYALKTITWSSGSAWDYNYSHSFTYSENVVAAYPSVVGVLKTTKYPEFLALMQNPKDWQATQIHAAVIAAAYPIDVFHCLKNSEYRQSRARAGRGRPFAMANQAAGLMSAVVRIMGGEVVPVTNFRREDAGVKRYREALQRAHSFIRNVKRAVGASSPGGSADTHTEIVTEVTEMALFEWHFK